MDSLPPHRAEITQEDVARALGLSRSAVSLALRNSPKIPPGRCAQIQAAAAEMGYRINAMAAALTHHRRASREVPTQAALAWINAWQVPKMLRSLRDFDLYWQGARRAAEKFGYRLEEFIVNQEMTPQRLQKILLTRNIQGILIPPHGSLAGKWDRNAWGGFEWKQFSLVRFGTTVNLHIHSVTSDQVANAMLAFNKIREMGYQRIAFVGREVQGRLFGAGFLWAQSQLPERLRLPIFLFPEPYHVAKMQPSLNAWLKKTKPDAILNDVWHLPQMLKTAGYRVPDDIPVAGTTALESDALGIDTGIDQNSEEIGRVAVLLALSLIHDNARGMAPIFRQVLVEGRWKDGASLPPRQSATHLHVSPSEPSRRNRRRPGEW